MIASKVCLTKEEIDDTIDILKGAITICYPMGLPPYELVELELSGKRDLTGTQVIIFRFFIFIYFLICLLSILYINYIFFNFFPCTFTLFSPIAVKLSFGKVIV